MPKHYGTVDAELRDTMVESYKDHQGAPVNPGQDFLANGFFGTNPADDCTWPQTFWQALDNYGDASILNAMAEVHDLAAAHPGFWAFISRIRQGFSTTSRGFGFATTNRSGFETFLKNSPKFCKDNPITEAIFHAGMDCHRELDKVGLPGLHVCFGSGDVHDIHVDMHQPANMKLPLVGSCAFDPFALLEHKRDLDEKDPQTVFRNRATVRKQLEEFRATIDDDRCGAVMAGIFRAQLDQLIGELDESEFRRMAMEGFRGEREAQAKLRDVRRRRDDIVNFSDQFCRNRKQAHVCVPAGDVVATAPAPAPVAAFAQSPFAADSFAPAGFVGGDPDVQRIDGALEDAAPSGDLVGLTRGDGITFGTFDRRPRVQHLQQRLNAQGATLGADGLFGGGTAAALGQFQQSQGLPAGETVDPVTAQALEQGAPPPGSVPPIGGVEGLALNDGITFGTWERRPRVRRLQELLTGRGFTCTVDGMFGPATAAALHGFQASRGLPEGDVVDHETAAALEGGGEVPACPAGEIPVPLMV
jgi:peptidoglycan hydrolase-like protein with peptidoglycan-binding domain